jgi:hypothetical protein
MRGGRVFLNIIVYGYLLVAAVIFIATFVEGWANDSEWTPYSYGLVGLIAALVWPFVMSFILLIYCAYAPHKQSPHAGLIDR